MRAVILKTSTLTCLPGSVVEVTPEQFRALGGAAKRQRDAEPLVSAEPIGFDETPETLVSAEPIGFDETPEDTAVPTAPAKKRTRRKKEA